MTYTDVHRRSIDEPEVFWGEAAEQIRWARKWDMVLDRSGAPFYRWFAGGELNTCYNCVDYHVETGKGNRSALIYDSPVTDTIRTITYGELLHQVGRIGGALKQLGAKKGDRVVIYMPMIPESVMAMLACARIGVIHSVVFGGFAPNELAKRIDDAKPDIILSASCGIEGTKTISYKPLLDRAMELARHKVRCSVIFQRSQARADLVEGRDIDWCTLTEGAPEVPCETVPATDALYILYTSGTTAAPKGVVRDNGGHAVALKWSISNIYGLGEGEVFWAASDVGWVVGHSYIVYGPLLAGATSVVYEGKPVGTPDPGAFWRVIAQHGVSVFFTAPTAIRAIKREDPKGEYLEKYDISSLKYLFLAGERLDPDTYHWARNLLGIPVIDHWWQTETGWAIAGNCMGIEPLPVKAGSPTRPVPGYDVHIVDASGTDLPANDEGLIAVRLPLPPGCLTTLWQNDGKYLEYMETIPGYYVTGDSGWMDDDGYLYVMGRADEVINVAGHRLSVGTIEEIVSDHPDVAECAVIGAADELRGQVPVGFIVLKTGHTNEGPTVCADAVEMVRERLGAVACFHTCTVVSALPKTKSGKILRRYIQRIADGEERGIPPTIEDPSALDLIAEAAAKIGYGTSRMEKSTPEGCDRATPAGVARASDKKHTGRIDGKL